MIALKAALVTGLVSGLFGTVLGASAAEGPSGTIAAFAGGSLDEPRGVAVGADGTVLVADRKNDRVRRIGSDGSVGSLPIAVALKEPADVALLTDGSVAIADTENNRALRVAPDGTTVTAVTGLDKPEGVGALADGGFVVADTGHDRVLRVAADGTVATLAGTGSKGFSGDGGAATAAKLGEPADAAALADGSILIAERANARVRRVGPDGKISTWAGRGTNASAGDGGPASAASLNRPVALAVAPDGSVLVAEADGHRIRRVAPDGTISTLAGTGAKGDGGDGGAATSAKLDAPRGVAVEPSGDVVIADTGNNRLRIVDADLVPGLAAPAGDSRGNANAGSGNGTGSANGTGRGNGADAPAVGNDHVDTTLPAGVPAPKAGQSVAIGPVTGKVKVRLPNGAVASVGAVQSIPVGAVVDASAGSVRLVSSSGGDGRQAAVFSGGRFLIRQRAGRRPVTELVLRGAVPKCATGARAAASAKRKKPRRLWGSGKGRFRTRGGHAAATVRGTEWLTEDRCDGTLVRVRRGVVAVRDFTRGRTKRVRAGGRYFARAR